MKNRKPEAITLDLPSVKLRGLRWGRPDQPLIIALHGWLDNAASFSLLAPLLTDYQVVAFDYPGHGHADDLAHSEEYSFVNFIAIFTQAIEKLTFQPVIFMGHSLGGAMLSFISVEFPHFAKQLIMIDSLGLLSAECALGDTRLALWLTNFYRVEGKPLKVYRDQEAMIRSRAQITDVKYSAMRALAERGLLELTDGYRWRVDPRLSLKQFSQFSEQHSLDLLAAITVPTLEIEASEGVVSNNDLLAGRLQVIKHLVLEKLDGPHHIHLAQPEKVAKLILDFLKE
jgi:pimeloyl-ACP methyl ester carboxylesterase